VPEGVPIGVVFALSTLVFRDPDLGVILLLLRMRSSRTGTASERGAFRDVGVGVPTEGVPAILGVNGVLFPALAEALRTGMRGRPEFDLGFGAIALAVLMANGLGRVNALLSRTPKGCRSGFRDLLGVLGLIFSFSWFCNFCCCCCCCCCCLETPVIWRLRFTPTHRILGLASGSAQDIFMVNSGPANTRNRKEKWKRIYNQL